MQKFDRNEERKIRTNSPLEISDSFGKEKLQKYKRLIKVVEMMISKRVFSLKEIRKSIKMH